MKRFERIAALVTLLTLIFAWFYGAYSSDSDFEEQVRTALPEAGWFESFGDVIQIGYLDSTKAKLEGYVVAGTGKGYGGPLTAAVGIDTDGNVAHVVVLDHKETIPFFQKLEARKAEQQFEGKRCTDAFILGEDIDTISGASQSAQALTAAVRNASHEVARSVFEESLPVPEWKILIGVREVTLVLLFGLSLVIYGIQFRWRKHLRWLSLSVSLLVLGFGYATLLTIGNVNSFILGYWPDWGTHLYWYLLFGIVFVPLILRGKQFYCGSLCPFGAAQECLGVIGGARTRISAKTRRVLQWVPRVLAWIVIFVALLTQNPGLQTHEVFSALFQLTATKPQFILMAIVLVASLFITRPWCNYLCPIRGVTDFVKLVRPGTGRSQEGIE